MKDDAPLLLEVGCEEIPARMIPRAAEDLARRVAQILDRAGLHQGARRAWGGSRRLAVRVEDVQARQADRDERVLGPPAEIAYSKDGEPTNAALGFAKKQGIEPKRLGIVETDKGRYVGFHRTVVGKTAGEVLAQALPEAVEAMSFPKTMRWGDGGPRWVRPVHWVLALHGGEAVPVELFGIRAGHESRGHRFHHPGPVAVKHPDEYVAALERAHVVVDPDSRRERLVRALERAAAGLKGRLVEDPALLNEVSDLVEWPGVVAGRFDPEFLDLPPELLVTTLRHHQKSFSVRSEDGRLLPAFLAVANTDDDRGGHVRRGNEWVVGGRLDDARFFWKEDRKQSLAARSARLDGVVFHARLGTYADKAGRTAELAGRIADHVRLDADQAAWCREAARLAKNDLLTGTVGEFPELQGKVGGLMLAAEGGQAEVARAVYAHYQPMGPEDEIPPTVEGCVVSVSDKLDSVAEFVRIGEIPTGSRDPFGLRRACSGIFRVVIDNQWPVSLADLCVMAGDRPEISDLLAERFRSYLSDGGFTPNEINAVLGPAGSSSCFRTWHLHDVAARLEAIRTVRDRDDFARLVQLTKRVDNILDENSPIYLALVEQKPEVGEYREAERAALDLQKLIERQSRPIDVRARAKRYREVVEILAGFVDPVDRFFTEVLVLDPERPEATWYRWHLVAELRGILTRYFDIRELAGQADRRG